jgi:hypothetical protein
LFHHLTGWKFENQISPEVMAEGMAMYFADDMYIRPDSEVFLSSEDAFKTPEQLRAKFGADGSIWESMYVDIKAVRKKERKKSLTSPNF